MAAEADLVAAARLQHRRRYLQRFRRRRQNNSSPLAPPFGGGGQGGMVWTLSPIQTHSGQLECHGGARCSQRHRPPPLGAIHREGGLDSGSYAIAIDDHPHELARGARRLPLVSRKADSKHIRISQPQNFINRLLQAARHCVTVGVVKATGSLFTVEPPEANGVSATICIWPSMDRAKPGWQAAR